MSESQRDQSDVPQGDDATEFVCGGGLVAPPAAVILAAGQAKRMQSDLVKVLHDVCGKPMLGWVIDACKAAGCDPVVVVVGHQGEQVREAFADDPVVKFVEQTERLGTGHAVQQAEGLLGDFAGNVIVLGGDGPLIRTSTLRALLETHAAVGAAASLATSVIANPTGYGRIVRDGESGEFVAIVEEKDATEEQRGIGEINPSYYCFEAMGLFKALGRVSNANASGEYYLTDVLAILKAEGARVNVLDTVPAADVLSINTPEQLAEVAGLLEKRLAKKNATMQEAKS